MWGFKPNTQSATVCSESLILQPHANGLDGVHTDQYALCPADAEINEECFHKIPLDFASEMQVLRYIYVNDTSNRTEVQIPATRIRTGTIPQGSTCACLTLRVFRCGRRNSSGITVRLLLFPVMFMHRDQESRSLWFFHTRPRRASEGLPVWQLWQLWQWLPASI